ncbi:MULTISPECIES: hypothetical protein [Rhodobacterales]|uniref:hypothetical protein n=1 Tax=Roseobacter sp. N2S TaxID=2663844 RepID=UPI0028659F41|nr:MULTISPECIES: hypothetical protein [Rhodobacterales]MDR6267423.1 hypothetical protein [Roseobacter sp. N2S]
MKLLISTTAATALMASMAMAQVADNQRYDAVTPETTLNDNGMKLDDNARYDSVTPDEKLNDNAMTADSNARYEALTEDKTDRQNVSRNSGTEYENLKSRTGENMTRSEYLRDTLR